MSDLGLRSASLGLIKQANVKRNDPDPKLETPVRLGQAEAMKLVEGIAQVGTHFPDPGGPRNATVDARGDLLGWIHGWTTSEGWVQLTPAAARVLNRAAESLGIPERFDAFDARAASRRE